MHCIAIACFTSVYKCLYDVLAGATLKLQRADSSLRDAEDFWQHAFKSFNARWVEMATPIVRLALFLHPGYRVMAKKYGEYWRY